MIPGSKARWVSLALLAGAVAIVAAWLDSRYGWITPAFDAVAHQFYEIPILARVRRPSQLVLVRWHLAIGSGLLVVGFARMSNFSKAKSAAIVLTMWALATVLKLIGPAIAQTRVGSGS